MKLKNLIAAFMTIIVAFTVTSCDKNVKVDASANPEDSLSSISQINNAHEIHVKKDIFTFADRWEVTADGEKVATIEGLTFPIAGDVYAMKNLNGNLMGMESEDFLTLTRGADVYDYNAQKIGHINQHAFSMLRSFEIVDNGKSVGEVKQNLAWNLSGDINNSAGISEYHFSKKTFSLSSQLDLTRNVDNPQVSPMYAIWMTVMINEIAERSNS